jgi:hypothetical protein
MMEALILDSGLGTGRCADPAGVEAARPAQLRRPAETFERTATARDALDDAAIGDYLVRLAKRRAAIGREAARRDTACCDVPSPLMRIREG